jgi:hypothetical protein
LPARSHNSARSKNRTDDTFGEAHRFLIAGGRRTAPAPREAHTRASGLRAIDGHVVLTSCRFPIPGAHHQWSDRRRAGTSQGPNL